MKKFSSGVTKMGREQISIFNAFMEKRGWRDDVSDWIVEQKQRSFAKSLVGCGLKRSHVNKAGQILLVNTVSGCGGLDA